MGIERTLLTQEKTKQNRAQEINALNVMFEEIGEVKDLEPGGVQRVIERVETALKLAFPYTRFTITAAQQPLVG